MERVLEKPSYVDTLTSTLEGSILCPNRGLDAYIDTVVCRLYGAIVADLVKSEASGVLIKGGRGTVF